MIRVGKDQWVLTRDLKRPSYLGSSTNCELITVIEAVSGGGQVIPPMAILPGKVHQAHWYTKTKLEDNYSIAVSDSGYTNDHLGLRWLSHFEKFSTPKEAGSYRLLL